MTAGEGLVDGSTEPGDRGRTRAQARIAAAAQRVHDRLAADPGSFAHPPSRRLATVLALVVLLGAAAALAGVVWVTLFGFGWWHWPLAVLLWAAVLVMRPRRPRLADGVVVLPREEYPSVHALVDRVAADVGVRPPRLVAVSADLNAYVQAVGWWGHAMVVGLPLWTLETPEARVGTLGHELGHLRGRDTSSLRLIGAADQVLDGVVFVLGVDDDGSLLNDIGRVLVGGLLFPAHLARHVLWRLTLTAGQHQEYLADRRAAQVVGGPAMRRCLGEDLVGLSVRLGSAVRRGEDPFVFLAEAPPPTDASVEAYERHAATIDLARDSTHPPDHLRLSLVGSLPVLGSGWDPTLVEAADRELVRLRDTFRREVVELHRSGLI